MTVSEAGDEILIGALAHITGREDDPLRIIVAEPENRVGKIKRVAEVHVERRKIDRLIDLDDGPVAWIDFGAGIARIDEAGGK